MSLGLLGGILAGAGKGLVDQAEEDAKWERIRAELVAKFKLEDARSEAAADREALRQDRLDARSAAREDRLDARSAARDARSGKSGGGGATDYNLEDPEGLRIAARFTGSTVPELARAIRFSAAGKLSDQELEGTVPLEKYGSVEEAQGAEDTYAHGQRPGLLRLAMEGQEGAYGKDLKSMKEGQLLSDTMAGERGSRSTNAIQAAMRGDEVKVVGPDSRMQDVATGAAVGKKNPQTFKPESNGEGKEKKPSLAQQAKNDEIRAARNRIAQASAGGSIASPDDLKLAKQRFVGEADPEFDKWAAGDAKAMRNVTPIIEDAKERLKIGPSSGKNAVRDAIIEYRDKGWSIKEIREAFKRLGVH